MRVDRLPTSEVARSVFFGNATQDFLILLLLFTNFVKKYLCFTWFVERFLI
ncbi:hypothetical protein Hanom_Chr14g01272201 [Helianthus anomalus]